MVNRGPSGGCVTCKKRRVKCDEQRPECRRCKTHGVVCDGYVKQPAELKFIDQGRKFAVAPCPVRTPPSPVCKPSKQREGVKILPNTISPSYIQNQHSRRFVKVIKRQSAAVRTNAKLERTQDQLLSSIPRPLAQLDIAVPFFLTHYASLGRDTQSARGYFEMLVPVYTSQRQDSALVLAVSAVASEILSLWRHRGDSFKSPRASYVRAVARVRRAVQDHTERCEPATVFAVLALQLYENIAAVYRLRCGTNIHQNGAAALLACTDVGNMDPTLGEHVRRFMLHTEVGAAIRQRRSLRSIAYSWIGGKDPDVLPENPTSMLDTIGSCVAELQATAAGLFSTTSSQPLSVQALAGIRAEAERLDHQLLSWSQSLPQDWQPQRFNSAQGFDSSIPMYESICEVYVSCPVADTWNLWRFQRMILLGIILRSFSEMLRMTKAQSVFQDASQPLERYGRTAQELMDSVCYSIPFYLGNRTNPVSISDFADPEILVLIYSEPQSNTTCDMVPQGQISNVQNRDRRNHLISQGPWHAMNPLSRLLSVLTDDYEQGLAAVIRPGQCEWIRSQFVRVTKILHLPSARRSDYKEVGGTWNWSTERIVDTL